MAIILAKDIVADQKILLGLQTLMVIDTLYKKPGKGYATVVIDLVDSLTGITTQMTFMADQPLTLAP